MSKFRPSRRDQVSASPKPLSATVLLLVGGYIVYYWLSAGRLLG